MNAETKNVTEVTKRDRVIELELQNQTLNQTVGEQRKHVDHLVEETRRLRNDHLVELEELKDKYRKEVRLIGHSSVRGVEYKNLDDVVDVIRKEEAKKLKYDIESNENTIAELKHSFNKVRNELDRTTKHKEEELIEAKSRVRERYNKLLAEKDKDIEELQKEIVNIKDNKTFEEIEEARKQEIIDLKVYIEALQHENEKILNILPKFLKKRYDNAKTKLEAQKELEAKEREAARASNSYPTVRDKLREGFHTSIITKAKSWWNKARNTYKYQKAEFDEAEKEPKTKSKSGYDIGYTTTMSSAYDRYWL